MPGCSANYCVNSTGKKCLLYIFPKEENRRNKWIKNCNKDEWWIPKKWNKLCEVFTMKTFYLI